MKEMLVLVCTLILKVSSLLPFPEGGSTLCFLSVESTDSQNKDSSLLLGVHSPQLNFPAWHFIDAEELYLRGPDGSPLPSLPCTQMTGTASRTHSCPKLLWLFHSSWCSMLFFTDWNSNFEPMEALASLVCFLMCVEEAFKYLQETYRDPVLSLVTGWLVCKP